MNIEIKHLWLHKCPKKWNQYTLIALVITIIVLLILAGISVGMLSGDNSIIKQAGNAKTQTDIAQEKEILEHATVIAIGKSKYGNVEKKYLDPELNKYSEIDGTEDVDEGIEVTFKSGRVYIVDADGNVTDFEEKDSIGIIVNHNGTEVDISKISATQIADYYGDYVVNYTTGGTYQLYYVDSNGKFGEPGRIYIQNTAFRRKNRKYFFKDK